MQLPAVLDLGAAGPLWAALNARRGQPVELDASGVERLGGLCLQVLLAAQKQWNADGAAFSVVNPSPAFSDGTTLMAAPDLAPQGGIA